MSARQRRRRVPLSLARGVTAGSGRAGGVPWRALWRQSRADASAATVGLIVIAIATFLAAALPQAIDSVATDEVRRAVSGPDARLDVVATVPFTGDETNRYELETGTASTADWLRGMIDDGIADPLASVLSGPVTSLVSPELKAGYIDGRPGRARFIYVAADSGPAVEWVEGGPPRATGTPEDVYTLETVALPIEVAISDSTASLLGVRTGDAIGVDNPDGAPLDVKVSGVYRVTDAADKAWAVQPTLVTPQLVDGSAAVSVIGLMVSADSVPFARFAVFPASMTRAYTYSVVPSALDGSRAPHVETQVRGLASGKDVFPGVTGDVVVTTRLDAVLGAAIARVDAGAAQASVLLIALLAVAVIVELLAARLVLDRRRAVVSQWRSRGATLPAIARAAATESIALALLGGLAGLVAARVVAGGSTPWAWVIPPLIVAAVAPPWLAVRAARTAPTSEAMPHGRGFAASPARLRRIGAEAMLVALAVGAVLTLRSRGVAASAGAVGADILVLAAPVLVMLAIAMLATRAQPPVLRATRAAAVHARGATPLLAAARTRLSGMAIAALVVAGATSTLASTLAVTVDGAQGEAAWDAVGGDVAVVSGDAGGLPEALVMLGTSGDLTVATATVLQGAQVIGPSIDERVDIVLVDAPEMAALVAESHAGDAGNLERLTAGGDGSGLQVLAVGTSTRWEGASLRSGDEAVPARVVGGLPGLPHSLVTTLPAVVVDRGAYEAAVGHPVPSTRAWIVGDDAAGRVSDAVAMADVEVVTRQGWLEDHKAAPVTRALRWVFLGTAVIAVCFAALAVALMVASGSSDRARAVARARVVGSPRAAAHRVAWLEVVVPVVTTSMAGVLVGSWVSQWVGAALDLASVTGGASAPTLVFPWWCLAVPLGLAVVARVGAALGAVARGKDRLGALMRLS